MRSRIGASLLVGAAVSGVALYMALRNVPVSDLARYIQSVEYRWAIPALLAAVASFIIRVFRWQVLLGSWRVGFFQAYHPMMIGFMVNTILPGRVGEVARPMILRERARVPVAAGLATVAVERVFDMVLLIAMLSAVLSAVEIDPALEAPFGAYTLSRETLDRILRGMVQLSLAAVGAMALLASSAIRNRLAHGIAAIPSFFFFMSAGRKRRFRSRLESAAHGIVENLSSGFQAIRSPGRITACLALSAGVWMLAALSYYLLSKGSPGIDLTYPQMVAVMVILCFFIALPSVPGFWGLWEAGGVFALYLFGASATDAFGFTLVNHAVQMFPVMLLGFLSAATLGIRILQTVDRPADAAATNDYD